MLKVIVIICCVLVLGGINAAPSYVVAQNLPKKDGHIPVYIRVGDTPLHKINAELAKAFNETEVLQQIIDEKSPDTKNKDVTTTKEAAKPI